jgi:hypothetical protein
LTPRKTDQEIEERAVKTILLLALFVLAGCVTGPPMPMEATDAPSTAEMLRHRWHWMESDRREKPRRSDRKEHVSGRGIHKSACEPASVKSGHRGASSKGQKSK